MKKQISRPVMMGAVAAALLGVLLTGCGKSDNETPVAGYSGGQKAGAVNNGPSSPGGSGGGGGSMGGATSGGPSSGGAGAVGPGGATSSGGR